MKFIFQRGAVNEQLLFLAILCLKFLLLICFLVILHRFLGIRVIPGSVMGN